MTKFQYYARHFLCLSLVGFAGMAQADSSDQLLKLLPNLKTAQTSTAYSASSASSGNTGTSTPTTATQASTPSANGSTNASAAPETRLWNLNNVDIRDLIQEVSRETGKNFIIDPRVQGRVTMISSTPMNAKAVYQVFLSTLQVLGYSAIPFGKVIKIVPDADAITQANRLSNSLSPGMGDEIVVRAITVKNVNSDQLIPVLRPLLPQSAVIASYGPSSVLIVAGRANTVERIAEIVNKVDTANVNGIDVIPLNYAIAQDIVNSIQQLLSSSKSFSQNSPQVSVSVDDRSNSILLSGNANERLKIKVLISQLDTPNQQTGNTDIIYLHYLKAQDLVPVLAGIAQGYYHGPVGTVIGTRSQIGVDYTAQGGSDFDDGTSSGSSSSSGTPGMSSGGGNPLGNQQQALNTGAGSPGQTAITSIVGGTSSGSGGENQQQKPKVEIVAEPNTNAVIINAPPALLRSLKTIIYKLDIRPAQILVEALIAEVDQTTSQQLGIQWGSVTQANQAGISGNDAAAGFQEGLGIITGQGIHNLQAVIRAIGQDQESNILSTPSIVVLDNHQAKIIIGQEVSVQNAAYQNNAQSGGTPYETYDRRKVALHLYVTPQIDQGKSLLLSIDQGNDSLQDPDNLTTTPVFNISSIRTSVLVNSGDILVLGGLMKNELDRSDHGIPLLKDIPGLGDLFKVNNKSKNKRNLLVFIRPIILYNDHQAINITSGKYNDVRQMQLNWFNKEFYQPDYKDNVLPPYRKPKTLPNPFSR